MSKSRNWFVIYHDLVKKDMDATTEILSGQNFPDAWKEFNRECHYIPLHWEEVA